MVICIARIYINTSRSLPSRSNMSCFSQYVKQCPDVTVNPKMIQSFLQYPMEPELFLEQIITGNTNGRKEKDLGWGEGNPLHCIAWAPGQIANAVLYAIWQPGRDKYIITVVCNLYRRFRPDRITPPGSKQALFCKSHWREGIALCLSNKLQMKTIASLKPLWY